VNIFQTHHKQKAFTLAEVVVSLGLGGMIFGGVFNGYMMSAKMAEWDGYNLAGHAMAMQSLEAARAAKWDTQAAVPVDMLVATNFPTRVEALDVLSGGTPVMATNSVNITTISTDPPLKMIRAESVWSFRGRGPFTNTVISYRAPDQ
jgi:hypothetical protein